MKSYCHFESPIGRLLLTSDGTALTGLFSNQRQGHREDGAAGVGAVRRERIAAVEFSDEPHDVESLSRNAACRRCRAVLEQRLEQRLEHIALGIGGPSLLTASS
jgi:hypothetical protein